MIKGKLVSVSISILIALAALGCGKNAIERSKDFTKQGFQHYKAQEYDEAITAFNTALELTPGNAQSCYYLGITYKDYKKMADNIPAAEKALERAIAADHNMLDAYIMLCSIHIKEKAFEKAENVAKRAIKVHSDKPEPHYWLAVSYSQRERYDEAIEKCKTGLRMDPSHMPTLSLMKQIKAIIE